MGPAQDNSEEMASAAKYEEESEFSTPRDVESSTESSSKPSVKSKQRTGSKDSSAGAAAAKRRCVSTACIACRKRKSKCDGNTPSCAACSSVYGTECIYDPNSDHRRKGVYKKDIDNLKTRNSTLQTLIQAILNFPEDEVPELVKQIRTCESLDDVAESIIARENGLAIEEEDASRNIVDFGSINTVPKFDKELSGKMGKLRLDNGSVSIIGGTSNLIFVGDSDTDDANSPIMDEPFMMLQQDPITSWTKVTKNPELISHLLNMYFTWHYTYFTTLSRDLFWNEFKQGKPSRDSRHKTEHCTSLLVNAMLALGCHFTSWPAARADPKDSATAGDHFFREAKNIMLLNDEHEKPRIATVQALALMSVREAGCGREARGWVYSGMSFRMAYDLGLNVDTGSSSAEEAESDARRITIWGCFLFDKCWSNYLGRQPQLPLSGITTPKIDVFPNEDAETWQSYHDTGPSDTHSQPSRTRTIALQITQLCEISGDLLHYFYNPHQLGKPMSKQAELKKLSELHTRLEAWRKDLPKELEPREGQLPNVLVMHMFFQLLFIHLFRPFLKYKQAASPLPAHVSPRRFITHSATTISKLLRLYRRTYGLRQICNIVVYIAHTACTVHLLNLPDKSAQRDIQHGLNHLDEIAEGWLCARRTLGILHLVAKRWRIDLPEIAQKTFIRIEGKYGRLSTPEQELEPKLEVDPSGLPNIQSMSQQAAPTYATLPHHQYHPATAFPPGDRVHHPSPDASTPDLPQHPYDDLTLPPQSPSDLSHLSRSQHYVLPQTHNQPPQQQQYQSSRAPTTQPAVTSPTALFGGVQGLMQDQDWWLRDSNQFFANWHDPTQEGSEGSLNGANPGASPNGNGNGYPSAGWGGAGEWTAGERTANWASIGNGVARPRMNGSNSNGAEQFGGFDGF